MFRNTIVVLAAAFALGGSAISSDAFAHGSGYGGRNGNHVAGDFRAGRTAVDGCYGGHDGRVVPGDQRGDVWHHWGAYYGPMIGIP